MTRKTRSMVENRKREAGMTMVELMIAMVVLAVGLGALSILFVNTSYPDNRNSKDTSATLLAQLVLEQISAQHPNSTATIALTDCAGTPWTIATADPTAIPPPSPPVGTGARLDNNAGSAFYGQIDPTQDYTAIPANYKMQYVDCGVGGRQVTYDVRWNIVQITSYARLVTVSARQLSPGTTGYGGLRFALPVTVRGIQGM